MRSARTTLLLREERSASAADDLGSPVLPDWHPRITFTRDRTPPVTRAVTTFTNHVPGARRVPGLAVIEAVMALPPRAAVPWVYLE